MAFAFERDVHIPEDQYVDILAVAGRRTTFLTSGTAAALGVLCLLWPYTVALGIVVLSGCVIALSIPSVVPGSLRSVYRRTPHLHGPLTCSVNDAEMWVRGASFQCRSQWSNLHVWRESAGWLVLNPHGLLPIFLRIDDLKTAGCYDPIVALARANGRQFGSHVDPRG
jgi:hypothetical protein